MIPGLTRVCFPNGTSIGSAIFAELTVMTNSYADHATYRHLYQQLASIHLVLVMWAKPCAIYDYI